MTTQDTLFTPEQIAQQSKANASLVYLITTAYLKQKGLPIEEWAEYGGKIASKTGWQQRTKEGTSAILHQFALNMVSLGYEVVVISGDENHAEATLKEYPEQNYLDFLGLSREEANIFGDVVFTTIMTAIGFKSTLSHEDGKVQLTVSR